MDSTAISLAKDRSIPIIIFSIMKSSNIVDIVEGKGNYWRRRAQGRGWDPEVDRPLHCGSREDAQGQRRGPDGGLTVRVHL